MVFTPTRSNRNHFPNYDKAHVFSYIGHNFSYNGHNFSYIKHIFSNAAPHSPHSCRPPDNAPLMPQQKRVHRHCDTPAREFYPVPHGAEGLLFSQPTLP